MRQKNNPGLPGLSYLQPERGKVYTYGYAAIAGVLRVIPYLARKGADFLIKYSFNSSAVMPVVLTVWREFP
jgi:hypothetical protein